MGFAVAEIAMRGEWDVRARWRLRRAARDFHADLVHAHTAHAHGLGLAVVGRAESPPLLVVSRRVDFAVGRSWLSRRKYLSPLCRYIAISNGVRDVLVAGGVRPENVCVVHSGVDPARFQYGRDGAAFRAEMGCAPGDALVGNVGALTDHKGHCYLIEAAGRVLEKAPHARFCIVGKGELRPDLERRIRERGLGERFRLAGYRDDVEACFAAFDLFALSSHLEGLCTSVIDAMLLGVPVVATRTGGVPDLVRNEETGVLVEPRNPEALANGIIRLLGDEALRARLSACARDFARNHFTADAMVAGVEQSYRVFMGRVGEKT